MYKRIRVTRRVATVDIDTGTPVSVPAGEYNARKEPKGTYIITFKSYRVRISQSSVEELE